MRPRPRQLEPEEIEELEDRDEIDHLLYGEEGREGWERQQQDLTNELRAEELVEDYEFEIRLYLGKAAQCKHQFVGIDGVCRNCRFFVGPDLTGGCGVKD